MPERALVCAPRLPEHDRERGSKRVLEVIDFLRQAGHAVTFACNQTVGGRRYEIMLNRRGVPTYRGFGREFEQLLRESRFTLAILSFWRVAESVLPMIRASSPDTIVIVDSHDLHFVRNSRRLLRTIAKDEPLPGSLGDQFVRELQTYAAADGVFTVSADEARLLATLTGDPTIAHVVPLAEDIAPSDLPLTARRGMVFVGNNWHSPNAEAVGFLEGEILPRIPERLLAEHPLSIVGHKMEMASSGKREHVQVVGWVPLLQPYLACARVSVVPVLHGAGTKGKLLQALMTGTPTVSTTVGAEGFGLTSGVHALVADDPDGFASAVTRLLRDDALWTALSASGRAFAQNAHDRTVVASIFTQAVRAVVERHAPSIPLASSCNGARR